MYLNRTRSARPGTTDWLLPCLTAMVLVGIGAWQQFGFSLDVGELAFFKNAYDEDTYTLFTVIMEEQRLDRLLSATLIRLFKAWTGEYDLAFILADTLLPATAFLSCWYLTGRLFRSAELRTFWALAILFSPDLFSLGSAASPTASLFTLSSFKALFGGMGSVLVPPIETSYLNIFRTFEPQIAYVVGFLFLGLLLRLFFSRSGKPRWRELFLLGLVQCFVLMIYSIVGYPLIALEFYVALILFVAGARKVAFVLLAYFLISLVVVSVAASRLLDGQSLVIASRLPSIGTSTVGSFALCLVIFTLLARRRFADSSLWLSLGVTGLPVLLMNQQIITGLMVSTKDWERYINHPLLVIGAAIFCSALPKTENWVEPKAARIFAAGLISLSVGILLFSIQGTWQTRDYWASINEKSLAMTRTIELVSQRSNGEVILVLDEVSLAPLIAVRSGRDQTFLVDYTTNFTDPIPSSTAADYKVSDNGFNMFEYWRLAAKSPDVVETLLRTEAQSRAGFYSGFFFNLCDYWYPCSDNRTVKVELIQSLIGIVVEAYEAYLGEHRSRSNRNYLLVTTDPTRGTFDRHFQPDAVASARAGSVTAYAFEQVLE